MTTQRSTTYMRILGANGKVCCEGDPIAFCDPCKAKVTNAVPAAPDLIGAIRTAAAATDLRTAEGDIRASRIRAYFSDSHPVAPVTAGLRVARKGTPVPAAPSLEAAILRAAGGRVVDTPTVADTRTVPPPPDMREAILRAAAAAGVR